LVTAISGTASCTLCPLSPTVDQNAPSPNASAPNSRAMRAPWIAMRSATSGNARIWSGSMAPVMSSTRSSRPSLRRMPEISPCAIGRMSSSTPQPRLGQPALRHELPGEALRDGLPQVVERDRVDHERRQHHVGPQPEHRGGLAEARLGAVEHAAERGLLAPHADRGEEHRGDHGARRGARHEQRQRQRHQAGRGRERHEARQREQPRVHPDRQRQQPPGGHARDGEAREQAEQHAVAAPARGVEPAQPGQRVQVTGVHAQRGPGVPLEQRHHDQALEQVEHEAGDSDLRTRHPQHVLDTEQVRVQLARVQAGGAADQQAAERRAAQHVGDAERDDGGDHGVHAGHPTTWRRERGRSAPHAPRLLPPAAALARRHGVA
jgi:hypothetical protein